LKRHAYQKKRSAHEDARKIGKDLLPVLGRCEASKVTRGDIVALVNRIADRGAGIAANRTLSLIRKIFNWAIAEGLLENNPALRIPMRAKEIPRDRILDDEELARFWIALDGIGFDRVTADVLRLQLLTGARIREIAEMHSGEVYLERPDPQWRLPPARSKSGQDIVRPLAPFALSIVTRRFQSDRYLFCCRQSDKPITTHAITRAVSRAATSSLIPAGFTRTAIRRGRGSGSRMWIYHLGTSTRSTE
jgi:integrase